MDIGSKVYYYRNKMNLTQEELAKDIFCSASYISKIENNKIETSQEMLILLGKKLGINLIENNVKPEKINNLLNNWFQEIKSRNRQKSLNILENINTYITETNDPSILIQYNLFKVRFKLLLGELDEAKKLINELKFMQKTFTNKQQYYFHYFYGLYQYMIDDLIGSLNSYSKAEQLDKELHIYEVELYFLLSLVHSRLYHVTFAIHYGNIALEEFNKKLDFLKSIDTQIILAINYTRINNYDKADSYLIKSLDIANNINNQYLISVIKHNLGYMYSKKGQHDMSVNYYLDSMQGKNKESEEYVNTLFYLIKEYIVLNKLDKALDLVTQGMEIAKIKNYEKYLIKFNMLYFQLINNLDSYLVYLENVAIPYFQNKENWNEVGEYAELIAGFYKKDSKYKKSSYFYKLAYESYKKIII